MPDLHLVTFNMWVGNKDPKGNLEALADDLNYPDVIAVQEGRRFDRVPRRYVRYVVEEEGNPEADSCILFVHQSLNVPIVRNLQVDGPDWIGPKHGLVHPPRDFPGLTVEKDDFKWDILNVHRTWTGGLRKNMGAYRAEHDNLLAYAARRFDAQPHRPLVFLGDWNSRKHDPRPLAVSGLAKRMGADEVLIRGIDGALVRNARGWATKLDQKYGSDGHRPVEISLRSKE